MKVTNEPRRIGCGAPDYVITHRDIPVGYIEAKDIDTDLKAKQYREQFDRYRLLCKSADSEAVEYSLSCSLSPTMVAEYKQKLIPKEVLRKHLREYYEEMIE